MTLSTTPLNPFQAKDAVVGNDGIVGIDIDDVVDDDNDGRTSHSHSHSHPRHPRRRFLLLRPPFGQGKTTGGVDETVGKVGNNNETVNDHSTHTAATVITTTSTSTTPPEEPAEEVVEEEITATSAAAATATSSKSLHLHEESPWVVPPFSFLSSSSGADVASPSPLTTNSTSTDDSTKSKENTDNIDHHNHTVNTTNNDNVCWFTLNQQQQINKTQQEEKQNQSDQLKQQRCHPARNDHRQLPVEIEQFQMQRQRFEPSSPPSPSSSKHQQHQQNDDESSVSFSSSNSSKRQQQQQQQQDGSSRGKKEEREKTRSPRPGGAAASGADEINDNDDSTNENSNRSDNFLINCSFSIYIQCRYYIHLIRECCGTIVNNLMFQTFIIALIIINAIMLGIATFDFVTENERTTRIFELIDQIFLIIFTIELCLEFIYRGILTFSTDPWLIFDTFIVLSSWALESFQIVRAFRIFRAVRLVSRLELLKSLVEAVLLVLPKMAAIGALLLLFIYVYAVLCTELFGDLYEEGYTTYDHFSRIDKSAFTLFQFMTMDWSVTARQTKEKYKWAWTIFIPFILVSAFIVYNLIVAVICDTVLVVEATKAEERRVAAEEAKLASGSFKAERRSSIIIHDTKEIRRRRMDLLRLRLHDMLQQQQELLTYAEGIKLAFQELEGGGLEWNADCNDQHDDEDDDDEEGKGRDNSKMFLDTDNIDLMIDIGENDDDNTEFLSPSFIPSCKEDENNDDYGVDNDANKLSNDDLDGKEYHTTFLPLESEIIQLDNEKKDGHRHQRDTLRMMTKKKIIGSDDENNKKNKTSTFPSSTTLSTLASTSSSSTTTTSSVAATNTTTTTTTNVVVGLRPLKRRMSL